MLISSSRHISQSLRFMPLLYRYRYRYRSTWKCMCNMHHHPSSHVVPTPQHLELHPHALLVYASHAFHRLHPPKPRRLQPPILPPLLLLCCRPQLFPCENIDGRQLWEAGDLCRRKTASNVDLNRNWPFAWVNQVGDCWGLLGYAGARWAFGAEVLCIGI